MKKLIRLIILMIFISSINACLAVKEYEKININDPDMKLASMKINRLRVNFQVYREAASGANGGKTGGGCGCN